MAFILVGYALAFGELQSATMSKWAFFMFQMAFVGKAINIMSGGVGERAKLFPLTIFTIVMGAFIYPTAVNISWGSDWLKETIFDLNMVDLAGSTVIHSTGGWALLAAILVIGSRKGSICTRSNACYSCVQYSSCRFGRNVTVDWMVWI